METIKKRYTTVGKWLKEVNKLCSLASAIKIAVYNNPTFAVSEQIFEAVITDYENIVLCFGGYFVFQIRNDRYGELNTPCLKMFICKQRPDEKYYIEA